MNRMNETGQRLVGLLLVLALHAAALYWLWSAQLLALSADVAPLFVNLIEPSDESKTPEPRRRPTPESIPRQYPNVPPQPRQLVVETPVTAPADFAAPAPLQKPDPIQVPVAATPVPNLVAPLPAEPVAMSSELSAACPQRSAPRYPDMSQRRGEQGVVVLRVELSETGFVADARVHSTSGFARLDDAALAAVRMWRCTPAMRNGQAVRASALQPFNFVLQGN